MVLDSPISISQSFQKENSLNPPSHEALKRFWNEWWDNNLKTNEGKKRWDAQLEYLKRSTLGLEILNEPQVFRQEDFKKAGDYHNYIISNLNTITDKKIILCYTNSASLNVTNLPTEQAKTVPLNNSARNSIIFDVHPYPPTYLLMEYMEYYKTISSLIDNMSIYVGEFNAGIKKGVIINERQFNEYVKIFNDFSVFGSALWEWSYIMDTDHPRFNMTTISENKIYPNTNFESYIKAIKENIRDTI